MRRLMSAIAAGAELASLASLRRSLRLLPAGLALLMSAQLASPVAAAPFDPLAWSGNEAIGFYLPSALATDSHDNVHVADGLARLGVHEFAADGNYLGPSTRLTFINDVIVDLAVDSQDNIYVLSFPFGGGAWSIDKFDAAVQHTATITNPFSGDWHPIALALDSRGNLFVFDAWNWRIVLASGAGDSVLPPLLDLREHDLTPMDFVIDSQDNVYVFTDGTVFTAYPPGVIKFDAMGALVTRWGGVGSGDGEFGDRTWHRNVIALDSHDNIYVTDRGNSRIQVFSSDGEFLAKWGSFGYGPGQFYGMTGLALDSQDNIYVAEFPFETPWDSGRVQKFERWASPPTVAGLVASVESLDLADGTRRSLLSKLEGAIKNFDAGDVAGGCDKLSSFMAQVRAWSGKRLPVEDADELIAVGAEIMASSCNSE